MQKLQLLGALIIKSNNYIQETILQNTQKQLNFSSNQIMCYYFKNIFTKYKITKIERQGQHNITQTSHKRQSVSQKFSKQKRF